VLNLVRNIRQHIDSTSRTKRLDRLGEIGQNWRGMAGLCGIVLGMLRPRLIPFQLQDANSWRTAFEELRGPPSAPQQLRELFERLDEDIERAPASASPASSSSAPADPWEAKRPSLPIGRDHDWPANLDSDGKYCLTYYAERHRWPTWEQRRNNIGLNTAPDERTLREHLPSLKGYKPPAG
jgi:hypothetical protein